VGLWLRRGGGHHSPYGDVVLAEYTQPFNETDVTYYRPLYQRAVIALGFSPTHVTADAAFDAWYVYECAARHGGIGAVPLNQHGHPVFERDPDGTPLCPIGLRMHPTYQFAHTNAYRAQRFRCPLLFPERTGEACAHPQFLKDKGCVKDVNWELGGQMRVTLDRTSPLYHVIYTRAAPVVNAATVRLKPWALNDPKSAMVAPSHVSIP
jgi:hypothetical protein